MLNALKLSELLAKNADPTLYPRIFVMSLSGTLMAYSTPVDIKELRDQAALVSMAWKEHTTHPNSAAQSPNQEATPTPNPRLETLTIETSTSNILIRAIQPSLLLILVGTVAPSRARAALTNPVFRVTAEAAGDGRYPAIDDGEGRGDESTSAPNPTATASLGHGLKMRTPSIMSSMSARERDVKAGVLHIQRKKLDALTRYLRRDFDAKGFVMPDDSSFP
ncbi:hypothetical protein P280DRAFT_473685 [Massarina eburnea CBS 473.64]|uniref:Roadblock/LAMTOR2 domain-containing protein n=1 Tax=Massarina eburnea CBS 473.64 TaxID=1395130 RepID=A0A6A6RK71_9PLEO|nr:hypothetical protein P280DRAFT_473685 [Massarina eburnea CBS 473.64]